MSSSCSCGSSCKCGSGCNCSSMYPDISETASMGTRSIVTGLAPQVNMNSFEGVEMGLGENEGGCKCGSSCTCDPCNC
uniref:Metallothionein-like protein n=1 Tax=Sedum polytrichoides TaxID=1647759 RepID=A0A172ZBC3_9MAGN|nr:metallothionein-like protein [Sedum polytrichoides]